MLLFFYKRYNQTVNIHTSKGYQMVLKITLLGFILLNSQATLANKALMSKMINTLFDIKSDAVCRGNVPCTMLKRHLKRDSNKCLVDPDIVKHTRPSQLRKKIRGSVSYLGVVPGKYGYDASLKSDGTVLIESRVFFKNASKFSPRELYYYQEKLDQVSRNWSKRNNFTDYDVEFSFKITSNKKRSHVRPRLQRAYTRGPYFARWSLEEWNTSSLTHEIGHVLGLDDEYSNNMNGGNTDNCSFSSFMCNTYGAIQDYHYYLILRRLYCK